MDCELRNTSLIGFLLFRFFPKAIWCKQLWGVWSDTNFTHLLFTRSEMVD